MREEPLRSTRERSMSLPAALRFNREIAQFAKQKQFDLAILCYKRMLASRIAPDVVTYNTMINLYVKTQRLSEALQLLDQMKWRLVTPSIVCSAWRPRIQLRVDCVPKQEISRKMMSRAPRP